MHRSTRYIEPARIGSGQRNNPAPPSPGEIRRVDGVLATSPERTILDSLRGRHATGADRARRPASARAWPDDAAAPAGRGRPPAHASAALLPGISDRPAATTSPTWSGSVSPVAIALALYVEPRSERALETQREPAERAAARPTRGVMKQ